MAFVATASPDPRLFTSADVQEYSGFYVYRQIGGLTPSFAGFAQLRADYQHDLVTEPYFCRLRSGNWLRHLLFPLTGLAIIAYVLYEMDHAAKLLGTCWIVLGIFYFLLLTFSKKKIAREM